MNYNTDTNFEIPEIFLCPITLSLITDPVVASDGQTYDKHSISDWIKRGNRISPINGNQLTETYTFPNFFLRSALEEFKIKDSKMKEIVNHNLLLEEINRDKEETIQNLQEHIELINQDRTEANNIVIKLESEKTENKKTIKRFRNKHKILKKSYNKILKELKELKKKQNREMETNLKMVDNLSSINILPIDNLPCKILQTLTGHSNSVYFLIKISDDLIASGSSNSVKVWKREKEEYKLLQNVTENTDSIFSLLTISDDIIAYGSCKTIKIWREENGMFKLFQIVNCHTWNVTYLLKISEDMIASGSYESFIIWKRENGQFKLVQTVTGHTNYIFSLLKISYEEIASGSSDKTIKIWRQDNGKFQNIQTLIGHNNCVTSLLKLSDDVIASASNESTIVWKRQEGVFQNFQILTGTFYSLYSVDNYLISSELHGKITVWKPDNGRFKICLNNNEKSDDVLFSLLNISEDLIAYGTEYYTVKILRIVFETYSLTDKF